MKRQNATVMNTLVKRNEGNPTSVKSAVAVEMSLPGGEILLTLGITKYPIFVTTRCITETGPYHHLSSDVSLNRLLMSLYQVLLTFT
jgi:hypothetical protein